MGFSLREGVLSPKVVKLSSLKEVELSSLKEGGGYELGWENFSLREVMSSAHSERGKRFSLRELVSSVLSTPQLTQRGR